MPTIALAAGETSGDMLGAELMHALRARIPDCAFVGIGGAYMEGEGLDSLIAVEEFDLSKNILRDLLQLPTFFKLMDATAEHIVAAKPEAVIFIDSPEINHRIAQRVKKRAPDTRLICYVAPSVWAWRRGRARKMAEIFDAVMVQFPFEPPIFEKEGGCPCRFVGHAAVERLADPDALPDFKQAHGLSPETPLLILMPGSRANELAFSLPLFGETLRKLDVGNLALVIPVLPHTREAVKAAVANWSIAPILLEDDKAKFASFKAARAAVSVSGTATLELGLAGVPTAIVYRIGFFWSVILPHILRTPSIGLANLILDRPVMPEFIQERATADNLAHALRGLLTDEAANMAQRRALADLGATLTAEGTPPSQRAAEVVCEIMNA